MAKNDCPCGTGLRYSECCKPIHKGLREAADAVELMRSRYSAYARSLVDYIIKTTHPDNPSYKKDRDQWYRKKTGQEQRRKPVRGFDRTGMCTTHMPSTSPLRPKYVNVAVRARRRALLAVAVVGTSLGRVIVVGALSDGRCVRNRP